MTKKTIMFAKPLRVLVSYGSNEKVAHYTIIGMEYLTIRSRPDLIVKTLDGDTYRITADLIYDDTIDNERRLNQIAQLSTEISKIRIKIHELVNESKPVNSKELLLSSLTKK